MFFPTIDRCLLIPKSRLITWPFRQIPSLYQNTLRSVDITLGFQLLHSHLQSILGEHHILGLHLLGGRIGDLLKSKIEVVSYKGKCAENNEENDERKEFAMPCVSSRLKSVNWALKDKPQG